MIERNFLKPGCSYRLHTSVLVSVRAKPLQRGVWRHLMRSVKRKIYNTGLLVKFNRNHQVVSLNDKQEKL